MVWCPEKLYENIKTEKSDSDSITDKNRQRK